MDKLHEIRFLDYRQTLGEMVRHHYQCWYHMELNLIIVSTAIPIFSMLQIHIRLRFAMHIHVHINDINRFVNALPYGISIFNQMCICWLNCKLIKRIRIR